MAAKGELGETLADEVIEKRKGKYDRPLSLVSDEREKERGRAGKNGEGAKRAWTVILRRGVRYTGYLCTDRGILTVSWRFDGSSFGVSSERVCNICLLFACLRRVHGWIPRGIGNWVISAGAGQILSK